jgi:hypothetical protein
MTMIYLSLIVIVLAAIIIGLLVVHTRLQINLLNSRLRVSLAIGACGVRFDTTGRRFGIFFSRWTYYFKPSAEKPKKGKKPKPPRKKKVKSLRRLPLATILKIARAAVIFVAGFLSRVQYDEGKLEVQPVIANPALAGMAFGWGQAFYGAFPGLKQVFNVDPAYGTSGSRVSGQLSLSIKNRQIMGLVWRLLRDLPIIELMKYRFSKRGK